MTTFRFSNGHIVTPAAVLTDATLVVEDGRIVSLDAAPAKGTAAETIDLDGGWIMPGFVDTQVNGGGGVLFNDATTVEGIAAIGAAHARYGTTAFMVTLISDTPDVIARALDAVDAAIDADVPGVVGIHVEGPVISAARKGIHDASRFQDLDDDLMELMTRPRRGRVMLTLAPERVTA
ncbi:MAG: N-acetylglucosamine-6-phosphate deacetylase, partial [Sphingomonas sp.]